MNVTKQNIPLEATQEHISLRNYMRDVILGTNDGLVSIFALVLGVAGSGFTPKQVFIAGLAGTIAGAISMALGEFMSTKSQEQVYDSEKALETLHITHDFDREKDEIYDMYRKKGFEGNLLDEIVQVICSDHERMLEEMMINEFGVLESQRRSPMVAAIFSGFSFLLGSLPAFIPFLLVSTTRDGVILSGILSSVALFIVGFIKAIITRYDRFLLGFENFLFGLMGGIVTYTIGLLVGSNV